jgi:cyclohexanecarboxyl-CoA dehydrogenase
MDYAFTEEQALFQKTIRKLVKKDILPQSREIAKLEHIPFDLWKKICHMGLIGVMAPEPYGQNGIDSTLPGIAVEEIAKGDVAVATTLIPNMTFCMLLTQSKEALQAEWLPSVIKGEKLCCVALTEPDCGTDAAGMKMSAQRHEDYYILNGRKASIGWGMYADVAAVFAKTGREAGADRISCFLVPLDLPGVSRIKDGDMGLGPIGRASLLFDRINVSETCRIGQEGKIFSIMMGLLDLVRVWVALTSIGAAQKVLDDTIEYVRQRKAFGNPIGRFEGVSFKIAEASTLLEAARGLCYRALWLKDHGQKYRRESAMCKWYSTKVAVDVFHDALILHGHFGYSAEALLEQRLRDVIGNQLMAGSPEAVKLILVRELLGKGYLPF